jgi:hypothetical protein
MRLADRQIVGRQTRQQNVVRPLAPEDRKVIFIPWPHLADMTRGPE